MDETDWAVVEETLVEKGAISPCLVHEDFMVDNLEPSAREEAIEELAETYGHEEAERLVDKVLDDTPMECTMCPGPDD